MIRVPIQREPTHPGEMLLDEFLIPLGMTVQELANVIHISAPFIEDLVQKKCSMTPEIALRLAKLFAVSPGFWMTLQMRWDLYLAEKKERLLLEEIQPLKIAV